MAQLVLFNAFNGLVVGAFYALMALGLSLILNLSGVINFAHGGFLAIAAYLAYTLIPRLGFWGGLVRMVLERRLKSEAPGVLRQLNDRLTSGPPPQPGA